MTHEFIGETYRQTDLTNKSHEYLAKRVVPGALRKSGGTAARVTPGAKSVQGVVYVCGSF
jgi:hypothetical protein